MENFDTMTDDQLRLRLQQYGFANLPVTDTTRKVLVKKLKLTVEGQKTKNRRETVAVTKFSSDEEPEKDDKSSKREKTPNRRATVAAAVKKTSLPAVNGTAINGNSRADTPSKTTSRRQSRATPSKEKPAVNLQDDSDDDIIEVPVTRRSRTTTPTLGKSETVRTSYKIKAVDPIDEVGTEEFESPPAPRNPSPVFTQTSTRRKTFTTSSSGYSSSNSKQPEPAAPTSKFGRSSMTTSYNPRGNYNFQSQDGEEDDDPLELDETNTPYLSNFAKRLSTLRAEPLDAGMEKYRSLQDNKPSTVYKSTYQSNYSTSAPVAHKRGFWKDLGQIYDSLDRQYNFRTILYIIFIVMIIVAIYVIFM